MTNDTKAKNKLTIRAATEDDRQALEALISQCYNEVYPQWYDEDVVDAAMHSMLRIDDNLLGSGHYLAAEKDGKLAGCGGWSRAGSETEADIRHFATSPDFMRQGVGAAILDACIEEAKAAGIKRLKCFSSLSAESFYARAGFQKLQDVTVMLDGRIPFPAILMQKTLA